MPELPDLVYLEKKLSQALCGRRIVETEIKQPVVFRILVPERFETIMRDACFETVYRHGPFLGFRFDKPFEMIIHPMLAGRFKLRTKKSGPGRGLCFSLTLEGDHGILSYLDDKKMGKVYLIPEGEYVQIPRYTQQGVDITSEGFDLARCMNLIAKQRKQVRVFLMDQTILSAIGNAYADEILFDAGLHPKTFCNQLNQQDRERLYNSIVSVIKRGIEEVEKAAQPLEVKVRDHMLVRNRKDQPCPRCGDTIRRAGVLGYDTFFCPTCQPPKRKQFIDWR